ncbi:hypothetical protein CCR75_008523 [Bremia lactucae]|uniref:Uncharacterized protein n=1 Tax=Bremia lactucae TaxID=4779 RepID=A0A976FHE1_BRELC|nr:hypothetical protein CCR75_008523 [Bremia lactucae]
MTSAITAMAFSANLKQLSGTGSPLWGAQVRLHCNGCCNLLLLHQGVMYGVNGATGADSSAVGALLA